MVCKSTIYYFNGGLMKTFVSASILSADFSILAQELKKAEISGVDMIHFDVMDGHFVPNISFGIPVLNSIKKCTELTFDVHLMITDPIDYVEQFAKAGADIISFHAESSSDIEKTIDKIRSFGLKAGLSIKPGTPSEAIYKYIDKLDMVLVMTVEPGFGGQGFIESTLNKIYKIKKYIDDNNYPVDIQVDGGINDKTAQLVKKAGASNLVSGSYLFNSNDMAKSVNALKN